VSNITWTTEHRKIRELIPWPRNPRQIKGEQVRRLQESVEEFGQFETVAIGPGNEVYNGHQRLKAWGAKFGPDYVVEVKVSSRALSEKEREKLTILAHKGAAGEWDFDTLANEFEVSELLEWGFSEKELQIGGFDLDEPKGEDPGAQIDKAEELRAKWGVESGQLWKLGEHRLICGDCTDLSVLDRVMETSKADLVFTDPPYNVAIVGGTHDPRDEKNYGKGPRIENDSMSDEDFDKFLLDAFTSINIVMRDGAVFYVCAPAGRTETQFRNAIDQVFTLRECIVWNKQSAVFGRQDYHWKHESILYGWKEGAAHYFCDDHTQTTVWEIDRPMRSAKEHPTQKPIELCEKAITNSSQIGWIVFEPFSGSGTTLAACERLSRKCRAVEISPAYVAVAIQRWADMTGQTPVLLEQTG
jgi:site-specific DNA-methyltransferase (adenine-specific)